MQNQTTLSSAHVHGIARRPRVAFFIEYRHCKFRARKNQRDKWNGWTRCSIDWTRKRDAEDHMAKCRVMSGFEELRVQKRILRDGETLAR